MPSVAGICNVLTGSRDSSPADRDAAGELLRIVPGAVTTAYQNRRFLESAVQFMAACGGIRQFIDIGCGLPGVVHETAVRIAPTARVAYVDHDPLVVAQLKSSLGGHPTVLAARGDLRQPSSVLGHPGLLSLIDMTQPVGVILTAVLHFVTDDDDPGGIVATFARAMAPGSQLVLSHAAGDHIVPAAVEDAGGIYQTAAASFVPRGHAEVTGFFDSLELMAPGVVSGATWRPGYLATDPRRTTFYAGLATKR
jgi:hypothetical protein